MFAKSIAGFVAAVVLVAGSPVMAQSSDLIESAERMVSSMEVEQTDSDQTVVRRRRSGGMAWVGGVMAGVGVVLALQPPKCTLTGERSVTYPSSVLSPFGSTPISTFTENYSGELLRGQCTVQTVITQTYAESFGGETYTNTYYDADQNDSFYQSLSSVETDRRWNNVGWATAATGGVLLGLGLSSVDVPVRLDVAPTGGFRVSHSLGW